MVRPQHTGSIPALVTFLLLTVSALSVGLSLPASIGLSIPASVEASACGAPTISLFTPSVTGLTVSVNGVTSPGGSGCTITSISWAWGDGQTSTSWFPASHTYSSGEAYTITATTHQSDGQTASASTTVNLFAESSPPCSYPSAVAYSSNNFPVTEGYQDYSPVGSSTTFAPAAQFGPSAISVGVMGGVASVQVSQGGTTLLSTPIGGPLRYVAVTASAAYCYANFDSNGQNLQVTVTTTSGSPLVAYNVYDNYISNFTASLITFPPQFAASMLPPVTPTNNGLSFLLVAPKYSLPTPLAIWVGEGFTNPTTGREWWAQIGFNNWAGDMNISYAGWGIFSNIFGTVGGTDFNYPLIPGDMYNFTMATVTGTTWEFVVNGTLIQENSLTGLFNTTSTVANGGTVLGLETLTAWGGNVNITNEIRVPVMASYRMHGEWSEPTSFAFVNIGENWWNNETSSAPGIDLWGIAGHLQDPSVPEYSMIFNDSLPMILDVPTSQSEPLYGNYGFSTSWSSQSLVTTERLSSTTIQVSPKAGPTLVSVVADSTNGSTIAFINDALIEGPEIFSVPAGTTDVDVYAEALSLSRNSASTYDMSDSVTCSPLSAVVGTRVTCTATFSGSPTPTGKVTWSTNGSGKFSALSCKLARGHCSVKFLSTSVGTATVTADYTGDGHNFPSALSFVLVTIPKSSSTIVSCKPTSVVAGSSSVITCTARVMGYSPSGIVTWVQSETGSVTFSSTTCTLTKGNCSITMTGTAAGSVTIQATYSGDSNNTPSSATRNITVK